MGQVGFIADHYARFEAHGYALNSILPPLVQVRQPFLNELIQMKASKDTESF